MAGRKITLNEALGWLKTLRERHSELVGLRNENSARTTRFMGHTDKEIIKDPQYDPKKLDVLISGVAKEIRILDAAIKKTNALTDVVDYLQDDSVMGNVE